MPSLDTLCVVFPSVGLSSKITLESFTSTRISLNTFVKESKPESVVTITASDVVIGCITSEEDFKLTI